MSTSNPPIVGDILRVTWVCRQGTQIGLNVRHYRVSNTVGLGVNLTVLTEGLSALPSLEYKQILNQEAEYRGAMLQSIYPLPVGGTFVNAGSAGAGTGGADPLPQQVSGIITLRTALAGRANRGRMYVPFPAVTDVDADDTPTAAYVTKLNNLHALLTIPQTFTAGANSTTVQPIVYHRQFAGSFTDILSGTSRKKWATQRRRGNYGRPNDSPV